MIGVAVGSDRVARAEKSVGGLQILAAHATCPKVLAAVVAYYHVIVIAVRVETRIELTVHHLSDRWLRFSSMVSSAHAKVDSPLSIYSHHRSYFALSLRAADIASQGKPVVPGGRLPGLPDNCSSGS